MDTKLISIIAVLLFLSGCADNVPLEAAIEMEKVGFWYGLWHGMTVPFAFIGSLIWEDITIYAMYNTGGWYNFGFWIGACGFGGSASSSARRK